MSLGNALAAFARARGFRGKGPLSVALVITRRARDDGLPLDPERLLTNRGGQVEGLSGEAVARILADHGITRVLSREGGRTSRGSIDNMRAYVTFLNAERPTNWGVAEAFWIARVRDHFTAQPFTLDLDPSLSVQAIITRLIAQVEARQREASGATIVGTVLQHLVGAKLDLVLGTAAPHHAASTNDASGRGGDFDVGDTSVHVTTAPGETLIVKCVANLAAGRRPLIVTAPARIAQARGLAEDKGAGERIDVLDYAQFLAANVFEIGRFAASGRAQAFAGIVDRYNAIVDAVESDPGLRIAIR